MLGFERFVDEVIFDLQAFISLLGMPLEVNCLE